MHLLRRDHTFFSQHILCERFNVINILFYFFIIHIIYYKKKRN